MELQFLTPTLVWEGFNPKKDPLETSTVFSTEKDNIVSTGTYFTSEACSDGKLRAFTAAAGHPRQDPAFHLAGGTGCGLLERHCSRQLHCESGTGWRDD